MFSDDNEWERIEKMSFDPGSYNETKVHVKEEYPLIRSPEGLRVLARALRAEMPNGFRFDFGVTYHEYHKCKSIGCGMGLARVLWFNDEWNMRSDYMAEVFGISNDDSHRLFVETGVNYRQIDAKRLANAIDRYLDTGEMWPSGI